MRTNIHLDDDLMDQAARYSQATSKRALVKEALQTYIAAKAKEEKNATYASRLEKVRTRLAGLRLREKPSQLLKEDRSR